MFKVMTRLIILCFLLLAKLSPAQAVEDARSAAAEQRDSIKSVAILSAGDLAVLTSTSASSKLLILSLSECNVKRRFIYDTPIGGIETDPNDAGSVIGFQGSAVKRFNVLDGREIGVAAALSSPIKGLAVVADGEYILTWSLSEFTMLANGRDNATVMWSAPINYVSDAKFDKAEGMLYISTLEGILEKRTVNGAVLNSFALGKPLYKIALNDTTPFVFLAAGSEFLRFDNRKSSFTKISELPAEDMRISVDGKALYVLGSGKYIIFNYPSMKLYHTDNLRANKLLVYPTGSSVTYADNVLNFYDFKTDKSAGRVIVSGEAVGFLAQNLDYFGNEQFYIGVENGLVPQINPYLLKEKKPSASACGALNSMLDGIYPIKAQTPTQPTSPTVTVRSVINTPTAPSVAAPDVTAQVLDTTTPMLPPVPPPPTPEIKVALPTAPTTSPVKQGAPKDITVNPPTVASPMMAPGAKVPDWALKPKELPDFSAVKSSKNKDDAMKEARKKIRDDVARSVMKNMLEGEFVKGLTNEEVKKRFLWMVAARTAMLAAEYAMQSDLWVSPESNYYLLAQVTTETVNQIYDPIFNEEMSLLKTHGDAGYLAKQPVRF